MIFNDEVDEHRLLIWQDQSKQQQEETFHLEDNIRELKE
jgi:hypothetical protein